MPRLTLTRGEIAALMACAAATEAAGTESDIYEALEPEEQADFFERLESACAKLGSARRVIDPRSTKGMIADRPKDR